MAGDAGKKRMSRQTARADFKRIKAKVGKKPIEAANMTDTSFKASSLHVSGQTLEHIESGALQSTRGKSIADLSSNLGHPAATVRQSALKGLRNVVAEHTASTLRPHLSLLLPSVAKSIVDEDQDVRNVGLTAMGDILSMQEATTMKPFFSLLVAFTTSALHGLDPHMRLDGARMALLLSKFLPSLVVASMPQLLPPFCTLLADRRQVKQLGEIVNSLVALLRTAHEGGQASARPTLSNDFTFLEGGRSRNSFLLDGRRARKVCRPFSSLDELMPTAAGNTEQEAIPKPPQKIQEAQMAVSPVVVNELRMKVRDLLVEEFGQDGDGVDVSTHSATTSIEIQSLVHSVRLLWGEGWIQTGDTKSTESDDQLSLKVVGLLLEVFPVGGGGPGGASSPDTVNTLISSTVLDVANTWFCNKGIPSSWISALMSYWLPKCEAQSAASLSPSELVVVKRLIGAANLTNRPYESHSMLKGLAALFCNEPSVEGMRTNAGRQIARTVIDLLENSEYKLEGTMSQTEALLGDMVKQFPAYMAAWATDFIDDSAVLLRSLQQLVLRTPEGKLDDNIIALRRRITVLFETKRVGGQGKSRMRQSVFEKYPKEMQAGCLGLLRMLGVPSKETLKALSSICARSARLGTAGGTLCQHVVDAVHSLRISLTMPDYLGFLVNCLGVPSASGKRKGLNGSQESEYPFELVFGLDMGVESVSRALIQCGSARAFRMLTPQFSKWLELSTGDYPRGNLLRARVTTAILAMLVRDMKDIGIDTSDALRGSGLIENISEAVVVAVFEMSRIDEAWLRRILPPFATLTELIPPLKSCFQGLLRRRLDEAQLGEVEKERVRSVAQLCAPALPA